MGDEIQRANERALKRVRAQDEATTRDYIDENKYVRRARVSLGCPFVGFIAMLAFILLFNDAEDWLGAARVVFGGAVFAAFCIAGFSMAVYSQFKLGRLTLAGTVSSVFGLYVFVGFIVILSHGVGDKLPSVLTLPWEWSWRAILWLMGAE